MKLPAGHVAGVGVRKATAYGGFGQQMLEKMGWSKGQGLGKEKHGMKEAIEVKKKEDALGVGATSTGWKWDWKYWEDAYNTGLKSMDKSNSKKRKRQASSSSDSDSDSDSGSSSSSSSDSDSSSSSDSNSDSDSSEDELEARIASVVNRDGTTASASASELKIAKQLAKDPWGRFGGRDGKMARIRQQEEQEAAAMRAKLGLQQPAQPVAHTSAEADSKKNKKRKQEAAAAAGGSSGGEDSSVDTADKAVTKSSSSGLEKKSKKQKKGSKGAAADQQQQQQGTPAAAGTKQRVVIIIDKLESSAQAAAAAAFKPTPTTGWWGAKMFASAGLLEGMDQDQQQRERGFDEDLQTKVYMDAHNMQRVGKKGLGKSTTLKIAGGGWQGKKVTFGEDAADEDAAEPVQQQQQATAAAEPTAQPSKGSSKSRAGGAASSDGEDTAAGSSSGKKKVKWGSLAVKQLQQAPAGGLKWKKLWPLLLAAATEQQRQQGVKAKSVVDQDSKEKAWQKLQSCSKLQVDGKLVTLAA